MARRGYKLRSSFKVALISRLSKRSQDIRELRPTKERPRANKVGAPRFRPRRPRKRGSAPRAVLTIAQSTVAEFRVHLPLSRNRPPGKLVRLDLC